MEQQGGLSDADLVRRALGATTSEQRKAAFTDIADRYRLVVFRQCARWFPDPGEAQDVCQAAFEAAFTLLAAGKAPERPDKLAGWLIEIARRRGQEYRRKDISAGVSWAILPEGQSLDEVEDDTEPRSGSAMRRAHVSRLVETVVSTLTIRQQEVYQLRITAELTGREVAERLGITSKAASNEITHVQDLIATGFGALILFQEGRRFCPDLALIIETVPAAVGTAAFSTALREQIVRHFDNCSICDDCPTCRDKRRALVGPYVPALIPILFAADLRDRIAEAIHAATTETHPQQTKPRPPSRDTARPGQERESDDQARPPGRRTGARRIRYGAGAGAGAVVVLVLIAFLLIPHGHSAAAARDKTGGTGRAGGAIPAALTADETAAKVAAVPTHGPITAGPLLGPDGRLWDETVDTTGTVATLVATNATTYASTTYKLPATLNGDSVIYSGAAAFDGAGHLWLTAYLRTGSTGTTTAVLLRYTPGSGAIQQVAEDTECATGGSDAAEVYEANDGAVWVACPAGNGSGGYDYYRMTPAGGITTMTIDNTAQPGTLLYLAYQELPDAGTGPLVQGPAGSMYGLSSTDVVQFTPSGQETMVIDDGKDDPFQLVGNGTGLLDTVAVCDVNNAQGEKSEQCINKVNADGSETLIADLPDYDGYNTELVHWAVMDPSGNVWMILDTTGPAPVKQYYAEVSPGGAVKTFPFTVPGDTMPVPVSQASPVITPKGGLWSADNQSDTTSRWEVIQIVPKL